MSAFDPKRTSRDQAAVQEIIFLNFSPGPESISGEVQLAGRANR
jgi:hypothetical protein